LASAAETVSSMDEPRCSYIAYNNEGRRVLQA
jgi:hypothetical protein